VSKITLEGNKVTRPRIIQRELTLKVSDTLTIQQLYAEGERSRRNLMNTGLFNFVFVAFQIDDSSHAAITYTFKEAWYTWPVPIFELLERNPNQWWKDGANFNRANYGLYLTQYNFRGRKETLSIGFRGGYTQSYNVSYSVPYINKKQSIGMGFTYSYSQNHEIAYVLLNNKENYYRDEANLVRWQQGYSLRLTYRDGLYQYH
jgi:outer membrane protein assembly factor BamA